MRWMTRRFAKVDRIARPWLISRFIDREAEFLFLPPEIDWASIRSGTVFDVPGCELGHHGKECSFDAILARYGLDDPVLAEMAKIVRAADTSDKSWAAEGIGLEAIAEGFRQVARDDHDNMAKQFPVYDALYAYCKARLAPHDQAARA
jgi:hypothetical protein